MNVIVHPSSVERGLENARKIIIAEPGAYRREDVIEAAQVLYGYGDFMDHVRGKMVLDRMDGEDRDAEIEEADRSRAARKALTNKDPWGTAAIIISAGFLVAMLIAVAVAS